jgi:hypothetical protein
MISRRLGRKNSSVSITGASRRKHCGQVVAAASIARLCSEPRRSVSAETDAGKLEINDVLRRLTSEDH